MTDQLSLDDLVEPTPTQPHHEAGETIAEAFARFHASHPQVYRQLVTLARQLVGLGHKRLGMQMLFEVLRWQRMLNIADSEPFKLNNNYAAHYARMIMTNEPDLYGAFAIRELRAE